MLNAISSRSSVSYIAFVVIVDALKLLHNLYVYVLHKMHMSAVNVQVICYHVLLIVCFIFKQKGLCNKI